MSKTLTITFASQKDADDFTDWVRKVKSEDGTPAALWNGIAASAIKSASVTKAPARKWTPEPDNGAMTAGRDIWSY
jgi:hypothetical protein